MEKIIGTVLNEARKQSGVSVKDLSEILDNSPQALSNIHSGFRGPSWGKLEAYLKAIGAKGKLVIELSNGQKIESEFFGVDG